MVQNRRVQRVVSSLLAVGIAVVAGGPGPAHAQSPTAAALPTFEAASVKPNKALAGGYGGGFQSGGRFSAKNMPLRLLLQIAYGDPRPLSKVQIAGGPAWMDSDGFDITAKASADFPETHVDMEYTTAGQLMLQALLRDRFKLAAHKETRQVPVYSLVTARSDGRLGPRIRTSSGADCVTPPAGAASQPAPSASPRCGSYVLTPANGHFAVEAHFLTLANLAKNMQNLVDRVIIAPAAPAGTYSFDLEFTDNRTGDDSGAAIFTALQEQLGLKLQPTTGPADVLVIDHVERPTED